MASHEETPQVKRWGGGAAAVREGYKILATTFLSLLPPLSLLLAARLSATRYLLSVDSDERISFPTSLLLQSKVASVYALLVAAVAAEALAEGFTGKKPYFFTSERRRLFDAHHAWVVLLLMRLCVSFGGARGAAGADVDGNFVFPRRVALVLGLHEMVVFWRRNVVEPPAVDWADVGVSGGDSGWVERAAVSVAFCLLWWRKLGEEVEVLAVMPGMMAEMEMDVEAADVVGWLLYYLTAAIRGVKTAKGLYSAVGVLVHRFFGAELEICSEVGTIDNV